MRSLTTKDEGEPLKSGPLLKLVKVDVLSCIPIVLTITPEILKPPEKLLNTNAPTLEGDVPEATRGFEAEELGGLLLNEPDDVETDMTLIVGPPPPPDAAIVTVPDPFVMVTPLPAVRVLTLYPPKPLPISNCPFDVGPVLVPVPPWNGCSVPAMSLADTLTFAQEAVVPFDRRYWLKLPMARRVLLLTPLPMIRSPVALTGDSALNAAAFVVWPVPPFAKGNVPVTCVVRLTPESVPPSVRLPEVVTVPVRVMPLTVPAPPTAVTVPAGDNAAMLAAVTLKLAAPRAIGISSVPCAGLPAVRALILVLGIDYSNKMYEPSSNRRYDPSSSNKDGGITGGVPPP